jgi:mono/diheme cytochrome c family protein
MRGALILALLLLNGCDQNMVQQPRYDDFERSPLSANGSAMGAPPEGAVAQDAVARAAQELRPPMSAALVARGRERYDIYCSMCHGVDGRGDGIVPARGFPRPPSYLEPRLVAAPTAHFYNVITHGYGVMYAYADRVSPRDRWAIAAYIRALQTAGGADAR